jgi:hypothetical protein
MFRQILRSLLFASLLASLQGCQHGSTPSVDSLLPKPTVHVDPSVLQDCAEVVDVPHRFVPYGEMADLWAIDRLNSGDCRRGKHAAITTIKILTR